MIRNKSRFYVIRLRPESEGIKVPRHPVFLGRCHLAETSSALFCEIFHVHLYHFPLGYSFFNFLAWACFGFVLNLASHDLLLFSLYCTLWPAFPVLVILELCPTWDLFFLSLWMQTRPKLVCNTIKLVPRAVWDSLASWPLNAEGSHGGYAGCGGDVEKQLIFMFQTIEFQAVEFASHPREVKASQTSLTKSTKIQLSPSVTCGVWIIIVLSFSAIVHHPLSY